MNGDDPKKAAEHLLVTARATEVLASPKVRAAARATAGMIERFDTRFKSHESILEKLERFRQHESPFYRLAKFNDALRYTIVYDTAQYWQQADVAHRLLGADGFEVIDGLRRWRTNYKGLNWTIRAPCGGIFEVQFHTAESLAAAEASHGLYERQRRLARKSAEWQATATEQAKIWRTVPIPPAAR
jgi:hypothetical protein